MKTEPRTDELDELDIFDRPGRPYADAARGYLEAGWQGVLPVGTRPRMKHEPPKGYTGREGAWPTADTIDAWTRELGASNVGLRLPRGVAGIDVDAYDGKAGADTMAAAAAAHGRLPVTWRSTSREDGVSGIYLFRVPAGAEYGGQLVHPLHRSQSNVELIQYHHRYAIAAPSIHPEGRTYRWIGPDGAEAGIPRVDELPELPDGWQAHLAASCGCYPAPEPVLTFTGPRDPVAEHLAKGHEALRAVGSRHEAVLPHALALVGFARRGSRQAADALEQLRVAFLAAVTTPGTGQRSVGEAEREWRRMTTEGQAATAGAGLPAWEDAPRDVTFRAERAAEPAPVTWRTLADVSDTPPGELLLGMLEPDGPTLAYAAPGVGKGTTGAWIVCRAIELGMRPLVFDAERRPREWSRRVSGLGGDRSRVVYVEPSDLGSTLAGRPFWDQAEAVRAIYQAAGADLFLLDSLLPAAGVGEDRLRSDAQAPFLFVSALDSLGGPSLSFGHPPKGQPEGDPFGSMAWLAAFRLTWLGTTAEGEGHRVRWRPRKRNERGHIPGVLLTITYGEDQRPSAVERSDDEETTRDALLLALSRGPRKVAELAEDVLEDMDNPPMGELERVRERVGRMLRRMAREGWVERVGPPGGRNVAWQLRLRDERP